MVTTRCNLLCESTWNHGRMWLVRTTPKAPRRTPQFRFMVQVSLANRRILRPFSDQFFLPPISDITYRKQHHALQYSVLFHHASHRMPCPKIPLATRRTMVSVVDHSTSPPNSNENSGISSGTDTSLNHSNQSSFHRYVAQQQELGTLTIPPRVESSASPSEESSTFAQEASYSSLTDHFPWMQRLAEVVQEMQHTRSGPCHSVLAQHDDLLKTSEQLLLATEALPDNISSIITSTPTSSEQVAASTKQYLAQIHFAFLNKTSLCIDGVRRLMQPDAPPHKESSPSDHVSSHNQSPLDGYDVPMAILKLRWTALNLSQRAHTLGLPFHRPLYESLMEAIALSCHFLLKTDASDSSGGLHVMIHQVVACTHTGVAAPPMRSSSLDPEDDYSILPMKIWRPPSTLFRPALLALIREEAFVETLDLFRFIRDQYGLAVLDLTTTSLIYEAIYEKVSQSFRLRMRCTGQASDEPITEIIAMLEPSVLVVQEKWDQVRREQEEIYNKLIDAMDSDAFERFADNLHQYESKAYNDLDELDDGDDNSVNTDESIEGSFDDDDDDSEDEHASRLSIGHSIHRMITRRVKNESAKQIMESFVPYSVLKKYATASTVPKVVTVHVQPRVSPKATYKFRIDEFQAPSKPEKKSEPLSSSAQVETSLDPPLDDELIESPEANHLITSADVKAPIDDSNFETLGGKFNSPVDTDQAVDTTTAKLEGTQEVEESDEYDEYEEDWTDEADNRFPDITRQVMELNESRYLSFTRRYADILWLRESADEESDEFDEEAKSGDAGRRNGGLDSDDDDDDGYDYVTDSDEDDSDDEGSSR
jgi:hypothetical protein